MMMEANNNGDAPLPPDDSQQRWLRYADVAKRIGVCQRTVRRDVNDGRLPKPIKVRGCVLFDWVAITAALKKRQQI